MEFMINMSSVCTPDYQAGSPYAIDGNGWPTTLPDLIGRHCAGGPQGDRLEINSHGRPGEIRLIPAIDFRTLPQFSALLRRLMKPRGLVEILACLVAYFDGSAVGDAIALGKASGDPFAGNRLESDLRRQRDQLDQLNSYDSQEEADFDTTWGRTYEIKTNMTGSEIKMLAQAAIKLNDENLRNVAFDHAGKVSRSRIPNGALFCSRLATGSNCVVRAAMISQAEGAEQSGNSAFRTAVGNWEGHVLDFIPGGEVRYAGFNLSRMVFRTHDQYGDGPLRIV